MFHATGSDPTPDHAPTSPPPKSWRVQVLAVACLLQIGVTAALAGSGQSPRSGRPSTAVAADQEWFNGSWRAAVHHREETVATGTRPLAPALDAPAPAPVVAGKRWIPTGTGMWTHLWKRTEGGNARAVVARAKATGLSHIYVRTGTRKGGFDGAPVLRALLPATRGTNIKVIAWDFPILNNPVADARRLAAAANFVPPGDGTPRVAAVAPDIETPAEGTNLNRVSVAQYYVELRRLLPSHVAILGTVPWPSELRVGRYPYATTARFVDAFVPMAYWLNRDPTRVTRTTMRYLGQFGKPVLPVGQAYDPRLDMPGTRIKAPSPGDEIAFMRAAHAAGAPSVSLWSWQTADRYHWTVLSGARTLFAPRAAAPKPVKAPKVPKAPKPTTDHPVWVPGRRGARA